MNEIIICLIFVACIVGQQFYFMRQIQKLIDKIMAGSYQGYVRATEPARKIKIDDAIPEDLSVLRDFS